jgi:inhibitor of KinA
MTALHPLGDQGALAYFADEASALRFASTVRRIAPAWLVDVVQAYTSVAVFFDLAQTHFHKIEPELHRIAAESPSASDELPSRLHRIPCCYDMGLDLERISRHTGLSVEDVIRLHGSTEYTVYAIGFCPGFPYLGYLPPELCGVPRLETPRLRVEPGTVGLTGRQTGIYTEARPGGWNLLGRTPLELVHFADGYFPLRTGDRIRFDRIDEAAYGQLRGKRLPAAGP